jgi:hypothetical protein
MDSQDLQDTLDAHEAWLADCTKGERAVLNNTDLTRANLHRTDLRGADLYRADLYSADLGHANLRNANLTQANLQDANLHRTDLRGADLYRADLYSADLGHANLRNANLTQANLQDANLTNTNLQHANLTAAKLHCADLKNADLCKAILRGARLGSANLSGADGLTDPAEYLECEFEKDESGVLCYKVFGRFFDAPDHWTIEEGSVIEENANPIRTLDCACGVNVATREWMHGRWPAPLETWRCRIAWPDLVGVVVPYNTDGKIRAERVRLLEKVDL